jgi:nucleoside triphosphatase
MKAWSLSENIMDQDSNQILNRLIVVPVIYDSQGRLLICKNPADRGVFPGQWGLPGGGVEAGESLEQALRREVREELGIEIEDIKARFFKEGIEPKFHSAEQSKPVHMVYLIFQCLASSVEITLNEEFVDSAWALPTELKQYNLNIETIRTFSELGISNAGAA